MDAKYKVKLADYGLDSIRKNASVSFGIKHTNTSPYTPPELLTEKPKLVTATSTSADIYSFGILLW